MTWAWGAAIAAWLWIAVPPASHAGEQAAPPASISVERSRALMGTLCTVTALGPGEAPVAAALVDALDDMARLEQVMSAWRGDSELSRLNDSAGASFACSADLFGVLDSARACSDLTDGAFDATVEPLSRVWDLRGGGRVPTDLERLRAAGRVDWRRARLDAARRTATLEPGMGIDLGGIGKGFALDRARERLRERGIRDAFLNLGGQVLAIGAGPGASDGWEVNVADPRDRLRPAVELQVSNRSVSTSAQSERRYRVGRRRYGHILDPRSGRPVESAGSVTVIAASATRADALSTALLVMGRERAAAWCADHPEVGVLWLEPVDRTLHAWAWNLPGARPAAGQSIRWRTSPSAARAFDSNQQP